MRAWVHPDRFAGRLGADCTRGIARDCGGITTSSASAGPTTRKGGQRASRLTRALRTRASLPPTTRNCGRFSPDMPCSAPSNRLIC